MTTEATALAMNHQEEEMGPQNANGTNETNEEIDISENNEGDGNTNQKLATNATAALAEPLWVSLENVPNVPPTDPETPVSTRKKDRSRRGKPNIAPNNPNSGPSDAIRRVTRVSRHAALTTKQAVWDSNELSIDAALSAVDQWEAAYTALRSLLVHSVHSARHVYGTAKDGVGKLEHGLLMPVRDWILLPAFSGAERAVAETTSFLHSPAARQLAHGTLEFASGVPVVGENLLAPALKLSVAFVQRTWDVLQYPIPSREQVRNTVDWSLTGTKWALTAAAREVFLYAKRADANITRTLSHTQWKVLGSGPYATLDASNRAFVIDHSCERYFAQTTDVARYELAAHIQRHNPALYSDLVLTGLLKERGGDLTEYDEWLSPNPVYRDHVWPDVVPFFLPKDDDGEDVSSTRNKRGEKVSALWFRLPQVNGKPPAKDAPWICFRNQEQHALEQMYRTVVRNRRVTTRCDSPHHSDHEGVRTQVDGSNMDDAAAVVNLTPRQANRSVTLCQRALPPPTIAQWYQSNPETDVMVDQQRYSVTFSLCCPTCREAYRPPQRMDTDDRTTFDAEPNYGEECEACRRRSSVSRLTSKEDGVLSEFAVPPIATVMRPNFWRFYGPGDQVRRATWFLDTARNGLQPFDYEAQAVLEDAFLFLKWLLYRRKIDPDKKLSAGENGIGESSLDESLLTVEVPGPDGTDRLVQFSSLTQVTAIQKGLAAAIAIFKRRVYRGAWLESPVQQEYEPVDADKNMVGSGDIHSPSAMSTATSSESAANTPESLLSDESLRTLLIPPAPFLVSENRLTSFKGRMYVDDDDFSIEEEGASLAVPRERMKTGDMAKLLRDQRDGTIDHLCLIVHGIGEMMRSMDLFGLSLPNLSSVCGSMRSNHAEVQEEHIPQMYPKTDTFSLSAIGTTGRVEYLPVEWHEAFSILTQRRSPLPNDLISSRGRNLARNVMIEDISLKTIPNMREFANDTLMDVLFFMSPEHHQLIIDVVTHEMNFGTYSFFFSNVVAMLSAHFSRLPFTSSEVLEKFRETTGFDGRISVIGHSLGSVISWDILNHQNVDAPLTADASANVPLRNVSSMDSMGSSSYQSDDTATPELTSNASNFMMDALNRTNANPDYRTIYPQLNFMVDNLFLLGSPVPVFLMIRNQRKPLSADFSLRGCRRVFNIFHPYDPVAYRLEGCIDPRNALFEPALIRHWNGGLRVQYRTRRLWRKLVETTCQTQRTVIEAFEQGMAGAFGIGREDDDSVSETSEDRNSISNVVTGQLNEGRRIDYMLQEKEIENANEYVAALAAHSSYWLAKDLSLFIARQIYLSALEYAAELDEAADYGATWETITPDYKH
jgi:DDHD domain